MVTLSYRPLAAALSRGNIQDSRNVLACNTNMILVSGLWKYNVIEFFVRAFHVLSFVEFFFSSFFLFFDTNFSSYGSLEDGIRFDLFFFNTLFVVPLVTFNRCKVGNIKMVVLSIERQKVLYCREDIINLEREEY